MCLWVPYGRALAAAGYLVLAIDLNGFGASSMSRGFPNDAGWDHDVVAAAGQLRQRGVQAVVLMGASLGGTAVVAAAARLSPPAAAVVDLSGPDRLSGVDAQAAAPRITAPMLFVGATKDPYVEETRLVSEAASHAATNRVELVPGASHGAALLDPAQEPEAARLSAMILQFVRQNAG
jgi:pimeloyl-ACP methyl ester carboxylesterase